MVSVPPPENPYSRSLDGAGLDPNSSYAYVLELAGAPATALDVGCNTGYLGSLLMERGTKVWGIDNDATALAQAAAAGVEAELADLDVTPLSEIFRGRRFDVVIFADVLEHLKRPDLVLADAHSILADGGRVVASIPNVAHGNVRLDLLLGRFGYTKIGLLDHTHLRFFTGETVTALFRDAGFGIDAIRHVWAPVDSERILEAVRALGLPPAAPELLNLLSGRSAETFQYVVAARPGLDRRGSGGESFWTIGDEPRTVGKEPHYLSLEAVPNVVAEMRNVIRGLEASLEETGALLQQTIHDKDDLIRGLEASLHDTRAYLDQVIVDKDELIHGLEASLTETREYYDQALQSLEANAARLEAELADARHELERLTLPSVTVIVVNWNGEHLLPECLASLQGQTYPVDRYQIVLVDNGSTDGSVREVRRLFPEVSIIEAGENLGFAGGNNLAISRSDSEFLALLNNDAEADPGWLEHLVSVAKSDSTIAAVNSKIWLTEDRLDLSVEVSDVFVPGEHDPRCLGAAVGTRAVVGGNEESVEFLRGGFGLEGNEHGPFRWISRSANIRVTVRNSAAGTVRLQLLPAPFPGGSQPRVIFKMGDRTVAEVVVPTDRATAVEIPFEPSDVRPVVQNAGSVVLPDGAGRDRGTIVVGTEVFYESDNGQFDMVEDVPAFCGAAVLLRREALQEVGLFDDSFFMYYEDTDLSLRLRSAGWRIVVAPMATVRHRHSATSVEWSPRFCYFTERNRLLMLIKNADPALAAKEWVRYTARLLRPTETPENRSRMVRVQRSLMKRLPSALRARHAARVHGQPTIRLRPVEGPPPSIDTPAAR